MQVTVTPDRLADYVRGRRAELGLSQARLSEVSGISSGWIGRLEAGTLGGTPKADTLEKLAGALRVDAAYLDALARGRPMPSAFVAPELPAYQTGKYPPTPEEAALLAEADEREIIISTFHTPGFWDRPHDHPLREDTFDHLRRMLVLDKRIRGA